MTANMAGARAMGFGGGISTSDRCSSPSSPDEEEGEGDDAEGK